LLPTVWARTAGVAVAEADALGVGVDEDPGEVEACPPQAVKTAASKAAVKAGSRKENMGKSTSVVIELPPVATKGGYALPR
jgi:hypothetical protein